MKAARFASPPANLLLIKEMIVLKNSATVLMYIIYTYDHTKERRESCTTTEILYKFIAARWSCIAATVRQ
ncbi:hypothetical protein BFS13_11190 [Pantoea sp. Ae16]|nr:hypothetical protein BFS13_11190 [Pantoea sp. Ae16]